MSAGLGDVKVSLLLDTGKAEAQAKSYFAGIGKAKVKDPLAGLEQSAKKFGDATKKATDNVNKLGQSGQSASGQLKGIGQGAAIGIKGITTSSNSANKSLGTLSKGAQTLGSAFVNVGKSKPLVPIATSLKSLNGQIPASSQAFGTLGSAIKAAGQGSSLGTVQSELSSLSAPLSQASTATGGFADEMEETETKGKSFSDSIVGGFENIVNGIPLGIGMAIANQLLAPLQQLAGLLPAAVDEFKKLEESISGTVAILGGGAAEFDSLQTSILRVSSSTAATAQEVGGVAQALSRAGFSLKEVDAALGPITNGAEATGTAYEAMGNIVVNVIGAFGKEAKDAGSIVDSLTVAANSSNQSVNDLGEALKYVGPIAKTTGQSLNDTGVALGLLANAGIKGSQAGTSFRTILTNLQIAASGAGEEFTDLTRGSKKLQGALALIGGEMTDANGELLKGEALIMELQRAMGSLNTGEKALISKALAGSEGLPALNVLINASKDDVEGLADALENSAGAAADAAATALSGLSGSFKILESNVSAFLVQLGSVIAVVLKPLIDVITTLFSGFNKLPAPIKTVATAVVLLTTAFVALNVVMALTETLGKSKWGTKMAGQIGEAAKAIKGLTLQKMISNFSNLASNVKGAVVTAFQAFSGSVGNAINAIKGLSFAQVKSSALGMANGIKGAATQAFFGLKTAVMGAWTSLVAAAPAMGAFVVAAAPFIAIGAGVAAIIVAITRHMQSYKAVAEPLAKSQETLTKSMEPLQKGAEDNEKAWKSWGDRVAEFAGPIGKIVEIVLPVTKVMRVLLNILGEVDKWNRNTAAINAAKDAHQKFQQGIDKGNATIAKNFALIQSGTLTQEEHGKAVAENERIIKGQSTAMGQRIKALDETIDKMKEDEGANKDAIASLTSLRDRYKQQKVSIDANKQSLIEMRVETEKGTGKINDYELAMMNATEAREEWQSKYDAQVAYTELQNLEDLKNGLISEEEARGRALAAAQKLLDERVDLANAEVEALQEAKNRGLITEDEYQRRMKAATKDLGETLKERAENELALAKATESAINKRLADMAAEVQQVEANAQRVQQALSGIFSVQGSGYSALTGLVNGVTQLQITKIDQVKNKQIAAIDSQERRTIASIERSGKYQGLSDSQISEKREAAQANFDRQRNEAERAFETKKRKAISDQIRLQNQINEAASAGKLAELQLWYTQQRIQNEIAQVQTEIEIKKAEAAGDTRTVELLTEQLNLQKQLGNQLPAMFKLKKDILKIEDDTKKATLATKAEAEGISAAYLGSIPSMNQVESKLQSLKGTTENLAEAWNPYKTKISDIPKDVEGAVEEVKNKIYSVNEVTFDGMVDHFKSAMGLSTAAAEVEAGKIVTWYDQAGREAGDIAATNIYDRFGDTIPAPLIKDQLIDAMRVGSNLSLAEAEKAYQGLGAVIPKEQIANILGKATGDGVEKGIDILKNTPIPDEMNIFMGTIQSGMIAQGEEGTGGILEGLGNATKAMGDTILNWFVTGFEGGLDEQNKTTQEMAKNFDKNKAIPKSISSSIETGSKEGAEKGAVQIETEFEAAASRGTDMIAGTIANRAMDIASPLGVAVEQTISDSAVKIQKALQDSIKEMERAFSTLVQAIDTKDLGDKMDKAIVKPVEKAKDVLESFAISSTIESSFKSIATDAKALGSAGLEQEFRAVSSSTRTAANNVRSLASSTRGMVGSANAYARAMERAANAAARAARSRWSGGPVQGGSSYTVNELGREMFMSNSGQLSEIKAPAFGTWRAPSSGTVIPAGMSQQIRDSREASSVAEASAASMSFRSGPAGSVAGIEGGGLTGAIAKGFRGVSMGGGQVVNNVQLTTQSPVSDASKILTDLARIKAQRRR